MKSAMSLLHPHRPFYPKYVCCYRVQALLSSSYDPQCNGTAALPLVLTVDHEAISQLKQIILISDFCYSCSCFCVDNRVVCPSVAVFGFEGVFSFFSSLSFIRKVRVCAETFSAGIKPKGFVCFWCVRVSSGLDPPGHIWLMHLELVVTWGGEGGVGTKRETPRSRLLPRRTKTTF